MNIKSINPFDLSLNAEFEAFNKAIVDACLEKAAEIFPQWKSTAFSKRSELLERCAAKLLEQKESLAHTIAIEMGKPVKEGVAEIEKCAAVCHYYAANGESFLSKEAIKSDNYKSYISFEPLGCILAVMPWNFPFWQVFRFAAPTVMAGNVALLKHASNVPMCALAIERIFLESGFPEGIFQTLLISSSQIPDVLSSKVVKAVSLTGSEQAGSEVASLAGKYIKKSVLELGGSDPFIVLNDADVTAAAAMAVKSRLINNGQSCIAAKRFIIEAGVYDDFMAAFREDMDKMKQGNPLEKDTDLGPIARADLLETLLKKIEKTVAQGGLLLTGGKKSAFNAAFLDKTILTNVEKGMAAYEEELFGPVATIFKVKDVDAAIALANDTDFGLGSSLWTRDLEKAEFLVPKINAGSVFVNSIVASDPKVPFGGINISGFGRELSSYGIKEFVNIKAVAISGM